ncbi:XrtA/PEP-CTERM system histidine kinase PrsK [Noviherbaspirillum galbum]|uniref:histidine kinase n=1 Tax=Noviherbaspirillum galbum TaxID=2709383 RepID=A0A6B3ST20_9BURK|nr:XrtA/PEP-CTERM system histidine kinase PrsK [Noviherbaspirillum galbum]NEX64120.1 PEP-CTERM system histidine kinase PrsK [Noviherbaspirillum galbum]
MIAVAALGYVLASGLFLMLAGWALLAWRGRPHAAMLCLASLLSAAFFGNVVMSILAKTGSTLLIEGLEILRSAAWCLLVIRIVSVHRNGTVSAAPSARFHASIAVMFALAFLVTAALSLPLFQQDAYTATIRAAVRVVIAIAGMALVEQLYRHTPSDGRWAVKFACFGIGAMFAYDFYLYSNATLFRAVNVEVWAARGFVNAFTVPMVALSFSRNPRWLSGIGVSRRMAMGSTTILGSACYMLVMATAGYYIRVVGGDWGPVIQWAFLAGAIILLLSILSSGTARSWLRVFLAKHFYHYSYDYREEWLRFTRSLSHDGPALSERVIKAIATLVESPGGSLWTQAPEGNFRQQACWNAPTLACEEPENSAFCELLRQHQWIIDLDDPARLPDELPDFSMPEWLTGMSQARIVVPLLLRGDLFGFVVLMQPRSKMKLNWEIFDLLRVASSQAASHLGQQHAAEALLVARQFESFNRMSTFVVHDLKNIMSQLSLVASNAERHRHNPEFQDELLATLKHSTQKMRFLLQRFSQGHAPESPAPVSLDAIVRQAVAEKAGLQPRPSAEIEDGDLVVLANSTLLLRVIGHLLQNAIEATPGTGRVVARLRRRGEAAILEIEDTGQGMSDAFIRDKLFKPFSTTKSSGMGIGVFESRTYIHELRGTLVVDSRQFCGTTFKITLPLYDCEGVSLGTAA